MDDIPILVEHFRKVNRQQIGQECPPFSPEALAAMRRYDWLGNIRELENLVKRLVIMHPGADEITPSMLPVSVQEAVGEPERTAAPVQVELDSSPRPPTLATTLPEEGLAKAVDNYQRHLIIEALKTTNGNMAKAARLLMIKRTTLIEKCNRRSIDADQFRHDSGDAAK